MTQAATTVVNRPAWVDLATPDPEAARDFYGRLFGWDIQVNPDPQYGGYALARMGGRDVAGMGPSQSPDQPPAWSFYVGTDDAEALGRRAQAAGGTVVAPAFDVGSQGRMSVFQDPAGAFISVWQPSRMGGFQTGGPNTFAWAELNARGIERDIPFYQQVFGWTPKSSDMGNGQTYTEFQLDGESIAGGMEMPEMVPAEAPSFWVVYFGVDDIDETHRRALDAGAQERVAPRDFPGGRFSVLADPQGAAFGLLQMPPR